MAVGFPTKANWAAGDVLTASQMDDLAATLNSVSDPLGQSAGKNKIINGDFSVNQRAFSSTTTSNVFTFDRWLTSATGGTTTYSSQAWTGGAISGFEPTNYMQVVTSGQAAVSDYAGFQQRIENVRTLAGQIATVSFWAKATTGTPKVAVTIEQSFGTGGSPSAGTTTAFGYVTLSTSWARYTVTGTIPAITGKTFGTNNNSYLSLELYSSLGSNFTSYGTIGLQNTTVGIAGVQIEAGSYATNFQTATGTIQCELAACQRYYWREGGDSTVNPLTMGIISSSTGAQGYVKLPVTMRVPPTAVEYSTLKVSGGAMTATAVSALTLNQVSKDMVDITITCAGASFTNGAACVLQGNGSTSNYLAFSAEL